MLACTLLVPAVALAVSLAQEKQYTATASLLFRDPALDEKLFGSTFIQQSGDPAREAATNLRLVSLDVVAARTARALGGRLDTGDVADAVDVTAEGQSDVASVSATDPSPRFAARIANTFAETVPGLPPGSRSSEDRGGTHAGAPSASKALADRAHRPPGQIP